MPTYKADSTKTVKLRAGDVVMPDYPELNTIDWRWIDERHGIFQTKVPIAAPAAPATTAGVFARAIRKSDGQVVKGAVCIHDNAHNLVKVVNGTETLLQGRDFTFSAECLETDPDAVQVVAKQPITPPAHDDDWISGIPKNPTGPIPSIETLTDDELLAELKKRGVI